MNFQSSYFCMFYVTFSFLLFILMCLLGSVAAGIILCLRQRSETDSEPGLH